MAGGRVRDLEKDEAEEKLPDQVWLETVCGDVRSRIAEARRPLFDQEALAFRRNRHRRIEYVSGSESLLLKASEQLGRYGPYTYAIYFLYSAAHPKFWRACRECQGAGAIDRDKLPGIPPWVCRKCRGAGFRVTRRSERHTESARKPTG